MVTKKDMVYRFRVDIYGYLDVQLHKYIYVKMILVAH